MTAEVLELAGVAGPAEVEALEGGFANQVYRVRSGDWSVVVKTQVDAPSDLYQLEADGLAALRVPGGFVVPEVHRADQRCLVLADLGRSEPAGDFWERAGRALANQHAITTERFGYHCDNYLGLLPQRNPWTTDGHAFFAEHRILRFLEVPSCLAALDADDRRRLERLAGKLPELIPEQPPSLLHGDLWYGNLLADLHGNPAAVDPAVYYGWPEAELAMVIGIGKIPEEFYTAYLEAHPLANGWRERMPLLHVRELLSMVAHFGDRYGSVRQLRELLLPF